MRDDVGERTAHGPIERGNTYRREGLPCRTANPDELTYRRLRLGGAPCPHASW